MVKYIAMVELRAIITTQDFYMVDLTSIQRTRTMMMMAYIFNQAL